MRVIYDDGQGALWIPTFKGLNRFDKKTQNFTRYYHDPKNPHSISSDFLLEAFEDNASNLWIIGKGGLSRFDQRNAVFINYTNADGFPDAMLTSILQDDTGRLWMGSAGSGLIRFDPQTERIKIFTPGDGLQGDTFWGDARFKTGDGSPIDYSILGYTQSMQRSASSLEEQREYLSTINRSGKHLLALINDVLEISRIEAGKLTFESKPFDLPTLLLDLKKTFDASINAKGLSFEIIGIEDVPRYVITDENKLRQVLVNLLGNAVKFTEQGDITLRVRAKDKTDGDMRLAVEVQDSGVGIAEDEQNKVFACFDQTASGRAQKNDTGLGLAISRDYVRMMGGDITLTSKAGKGCTFRFEINIKEGRAADLKARILKQRVIGLQPGQKVPRVLVADDKSDSRTLLVKLLTAVGFEVEEAGHGKEAVEIFNEWHPDFIWMDIRMPVMDGYEATRRIRKTSAGKSTVVVSLTAHALEEESRQILDTGCDGFVRKPYREQEIFEMMAKHLGLQYVYEEKPVELEAGSETEAEITSEQLATLPADMRNRLQQAAIELDEGRISNIIEQIKAHDAHTAAGLKTIVHNLEFRRLLNLLHGGQTKPGGSP